MHEIHAAFNEVCENISNINREKEINYQYLHTIIELVDTGILSYQIQSGEVVWMNQALKILLNIPYLKNFHALRQRVPGMYESLQNMSAGKSSLLLLPGEYDQGKVQVTSSIFIKQGVEYRLLAFHDVNKVLDEAESKAWQRLLNVMTHEIMNSIAPISSLAGTLKNFMNRIKEDGKGNHIEDLGLGIDTIVRRSKGLLTFAETYRNLNKITRLNITNFHVGELFEHIIQLMQPSLTLKNIEMEIILKDPLLTIDADISLIEQTLINLILNAIEAVKDASEPRIVLMASLNKEHPEIKVTDNGTGIPYDITDKIFVPFFSTRKNGNGIGLSLCKQIMMLHNGKIRMNTLEGKGTCFTLSF
jgi:nitrogen fixation/metabolism regulation signal transduction histidine kinase